MFLRFTVLHCALLFALQPLPTLSAENSCGCEISDNTITFNGTAEVVDGDTIWVGIHKVRLYGIEALEEKQTCTKDGVRFRCYEKALLRLKELAQGQAVTCRIDLTNFGKPKMHFNRYVGTCKVGEQEINRALVAEGWVVAGEGDTGKVYRATQAKAALDKLGIHQSEFIMPWAFRRNSKKKITNCPSGTHQCKPK